MKLRVGLCVLLTGCAAPLVGRVTGVAAPVPIMLGPVRCIGTCGLEPSVKHPYDASLRSEMSSLAKASSTSVTSTDTTITTTTTTTTTQRRNLAVVFAAPVMRPLVRLPISPRAVVQLSSLDLGRALDTYGAFTNGSLGFSNSRFTGDSQSLIRLLAIGVGYSYVLPAAATAQPRSVEPTRQAPAQPRKNKP